MSASKVAQRLGVSPRTIARWVTMGLFPNAYKLNPEGEKSAYVIPESDIIAFEEKRRSSIPKEPHE
jgi:predicted site-specific integrase-resolvase